MVTENEKHRAAVTALMRLPGVVVTGCYLQPMALSVRIKNAVIRNLESGVIVGGGQAAGLCRHFNTGLELGCLDTWGWSLTIPAGALTMDQREEVIQLLKADLVGWLLSNKHRSYVQQNQAGYEKQLAYRERQIRQGGQVTVAPHDRTNTLRAIAKVLTVTRTPEQMAKTNEIIDAIKNNTAMQLL